MDKETILEPPEAIIDPPEAIVPPSALRTSEKSYDGSQLDYGSELGFKHVHFPDEPSLVKIVFLPPLPKKVGIVKKVAKKLCCSS